MGGRALYRGRRPTAHRHVRDLSSAFVSRVYDRDTRRRRGRRKEEADASGRIGQWVEKEEARIVITLAFATREKENTSDVSKSVRWSTVTVYEFGVAIGGSAIPKRGGPSVGLARKPLSVWSSPVDVYDSSEDADDSGLSSNDDSSGNKDRKAAAEESVQDRHKRLARRRRRVRWLKPLERVTMLTDAGCSEKRIHRMLMECSEIAMSRRLCRTMQRCVAV
ncbi:hypothetical protein FI667_g757, partial [Globisporangium splendens]